MGISKHKNSKQKLKNNVEKRKYEYFYEFAYSQFEAQTKLLLSHKKEIQISIEEASNLTKYQFHPHILNSKLKDVQTSDTSRLVSKCYITPKVSPASVAMLRIPDHGEFAMSSSGSPLLVSTSGSDSTPGINIPLKNGKKMIILPHPRVNTEFIRTNLNEEVRNQLQTLQNTLHAILSRS